MWMLHALERAKPEMVRAQTWFLTRACQILGLSEYLLPRPRDPIEYAVALLRAREHAGALHFLDPSPRVDSNLLFPRVKPGFAWAESIGFNLGNLVRQLRLFGDSTCGTVCRGMAGRQSVPGGPPWVMTDARLYVVGFTLLQLARPGRY